MPATGDVLVSVIIPVWNGEDCIRDCLCSLHAQTFPEQHFEIIVVDNGSTDGTRDVVEAFPQAMLLREAKPGSYAARNRGLEQARGKYVAFTDADCVPDARWVESGYRALVGDKSVGIAAGRIELTQLDVTGSRSGALLYERLFAFKQEASARGGHCVTANWMSSREVVDRFGRFDPELKSGGDWLLSGKISRSGLEVLYVADMLVRHPTRGRFRDLAAKRRRVAGGEFVRRGGRDAILPILFATAVGAARKSIPVFRSDYSVADKMRVMAVVWSLAAIGALEFVRLAIGREPRRS
jgi:glycosyltransferase involved in cell wall biosynthesis